MKRSAASLVVLALAGGLAGCVQPPPTAVVIANPYPPVPAVPATAGFVPKPPVSATPLIWQPGHWEWTGNAYAWIQGRWVERAGHGTLWQDGFWSNVNGVWTWIPGHWVG